MSDYDIDEVFPPMSEDEKRSLVVVGSPGHGLALHPAEYTDFVKWLRECCGLSLGSMSDSQIVSAWLRWQDELFYAENPDFLY